MLAAGNIVTFSLGRMGPQHRRCPDRRRPPGDTPADFRRLPSPTSEQPDFIPANNSVTFVMQVSPSTADLAVKLFAAPNPTLVGSPLTYTVSVTNNGPSSASGITVTNVLPASASILSATGALGSFQTVGQAVFWRGLGLVSGAGAAATIVVVPTAEGTITATATAGGDQFDPVTANSSATDNTVVGPAADLAIGLTQNPNPAVAGSNVTYVVSVTNFGPSVATGVIVNNFLPPGFSVVSTAPSQGSTSISNTAVIWNVGTLAGGAKTTLSIVAATSTNGTFNSTATAIAAQADPNPANNSASVSTVVTMPFISVVRAGATLTYESGPTNGAVDMGETVTMVLRLRNEGNLSTRNLVATLSTNSGVVPVPPIPRKLTASCSPAASPSAVPLPSRPTAPAAAPSAQPCCSRTASVTTRPSASPSPCPARWRSPTPTPSLIPNPAAPNLPHRSLAPPCPTPRSSPSPISSASSARSPSLSPT